jgi:hypothetical protein
VVKNNKGKGPAAAIHPHSERMDRESGKVQYQQMFKTMEKAIKSVDPPVRSHSWMAKAQCGSADLRDRLSHSFKRAPSPFPSASSSPEPGLTAT